MGKNFLDSHNSSSTRRHVYIGMTLMLLLAVAAIIFAIVKDDSQESHLSHRIPYHLLKLGDVLLRNGNSLDSAVIRRLSHCTYSHIGIITQINKGGIQITHATIDEKMPDGTSVHSFVRRIAVNPVTGTAAVAVAVLSVTSPNEKAE